MTSKVCPKCQGKSYSAADRAYWNCPYCGEDLRNVPTEEKIYTTSSNEKTNKNQRIRLFVIEGGNCIKNEEV